MSSISTKPFALGTVQWGLGYGIANRHGQPSEEVVARILSRAREKGVRELDTARAYGDSEAVIGRLVGNDSYWHVVTKLDGDVAAVTTEREALARTHASVEASLAALRRPRLDTLLLHVAAHRTAFNGAIWRALLKLRSDGVIGRLGVSTNSPSEAFAALASDGVEVLQVATNLLDQRLLRSGFFARAVAAGTHVYVRSVYLQGVAFFAPGHLPPYLAPLAEPLAQLDTAARARGVTRAELFFGFARGIEGATLVIGCETEEQGARNLELLASPPLDLAEAAALGASVPALDDTVLTPSMWSR